MAEDEDLDIELSLSPLRKSTAGPQKGRRAGTGGVNQTSAKPNQQETNKLSGVSGSDELFLESRRGSGGGENKLFGRRSTSKGRSRGTGWGEDDEPRAPPTSIGRRRSSGGFGQAGNSSDDETDDAGAAIPDLDKVVEEDMAMAVADAPSVAVNRVATYKELDNDLLKHVAFATLDGDIDLRLLTRCMAPEAALKEPDQPWHWDQVFAQVSGELRREWFPEDDETGLVQESNQTSSSTKTNKTGFKNDDGGSRVTRDRPYTAFNRFPV